MKRFIPTIIFLLLFTLLLLGMAGCAGEKRGLYDYAGSEFHADGCRQEIQYNKIKPIEIGAGETGFDTAQGSELIKCLPSTAPHDYWIFPLYSVELKGLKAGDKIDARFEGQFTNDYETDFMVVTFLGLGPVPAPVFHTEVSVRNGYNISWQMHHGPFWRSKRFTATETMLVNLDMQRAYLTVFAYAADGRHLPPTKLTVDQGYGGLSGFILRDPQPTP